MQLGHANFSQYVHIFNLATSVVIYLTVTFFEAWANTISGTWLHGDFMCRFLPFCCRLSVGLSAYSVAVLSFQRYRVTVKLLHVRVSAQKSCRVILAIICGMWNVAALLALPKSLSKHMCVEFTIFRRIKYYKIVVIFELLVSCVLPLCVIAFTYIMTDRHLVESSRSISEGTQNPQLKTR